MVCIFRWTDASVHFYFDVFEGDPGVSARSTTKPNVQKGEAILQEAVRVFACDGFRGTDVQEIADRAGVGKGTVYRYFGDKQELFWAAVYWVLEKLDTHLAGEMTAHQKPLDKLRASCLAYGQFFATNPEYLEIFVLDRAEFRGTAPELHLERHEKMIREFSKIIEQGIAAGEIRPVDSRKTVWALGSTLYGSVVFAAYASVDQSITEAAVYATDLFLEGITAEPSVWGGKS